MRPIANYFFRNRTHLTAGLLFVLVAAFTGAHAAENGLLHTQSGRHGFQTGRASWYGRYFQGQKTASGEPFDMNAFTCAHRSLPLGSLLKVTNLRNRKSVLVRVNDRGPVPEDRILDLSYAAAHSLGFSRRGTAPVQVEVITTSPEVAQLLWPEQPHRR
jgi:rare lipoprotein A